MHDSEIMQMLEEFAYTPFVVSNTVVKTRGAASLSMFCMSSFCQSLAEEHIHSKSAIEGKSMDMICAKMRAILLSIFQQAVCQQAKKQEKGKQECSAKERIPHSGAVRYHLWPPKQTENKNLPKLFFLSWPPYEENSTRRFSNLNLCQKQPLYLRLTAELPVFVVSDWSTHVFAVRGL